MTVTRADAAVPRRPARTRKVRQAAAKVVVAANEKTKTPTPTTIKAIADGRREAE